RRVKRDFTQRISNSRFLVHLRRRSVTRPDAGALGGERSPDHHCAQTLIESDSRFAKKRLGAPQCRAQAGAKPVPGNRRALRPRTQIENLSAVLRRVDESESGLADAPTLGNGHVAGVTFGICGVGDGGWASDT